ncbi:hypothetical protein [Thermogymnomonas acidicola]|uniref:hypothetical protein n=1 Tax=Thermogymnomonas acidicola TaxID=399579 RepID=UPI0016694CCB|nr:hypothetical protein [Thermogymnomonas acidicola]
MKVSLILPSQKSRFSNLYEVYTDLSSGLTRIGVESQIVWVRTDDKLRIPFGELIRTDGKERYPFGSAIEVDGSQLRTTLDELQREGSFIVGVDDYWFMNWLGDQHIRNLAIWAHYFYGHTFLFKRYRNAAGGLVRMATGYLPNELAIRTARFYTRPMFLHPVFAQSLWTSMLLERFLTVSVKGVLYIPVEAKLYENALRKEKSGILAFIGGPKDTDLSALDSTLKIMAQRNELIDFFGDEKFGLKFGEIYGWKMNFIGKVERTELIRNYAEHEVVISPIFNGTFEMVPIQSLLSGTPVISFTQPFMEVVGPSEMVANINNPGEMRRKSSIWKCLDQDTVKRVKERILEKMESSKVARDLVTMLQDLFMREF